MFFSRTITSGSFLLERDPSICLTEFRNVFSCSWYLKSFFSIKEKKKGLKNCSGFSQEYHNEKSLELSWHQTPAHWCVTTVFKPHWALVLHQRFPLSHLPLFFFFPWEDPWIIRFWNRGGMNKSFIASFKLTEILSVQLNISDWRDHSAKVAEPCKVKLMGEIFQLCAWEMFPAIASNVFYLSSFSSLRVCLPMGGKGAGGAPFLPSFYLLHNL